MLAPSEEIVKFCHTFLVVISIYAIREYLFILHVNLDYYCSQGMLKNTREAIRIDIGGLVFAYALRNIFEIFSNQPEIRLYLPFCA